MKSKRFTALILSALLIVSSTSAVLAKPIESYVPPKNAEISNSSATKNERSISFDDDWKFHLGNLPNAQEKSFDDSSWRNVTLPHDWSIELKFNPSSPATHEGGWLDGGTGWYRKTFVLPTSMAGKRISVDFGGVYMDSYTYVNGTQVGRHPYGYTPFSYDITNLVKADGVTKNTIAIQVNNRQPSSRWYSGSGIYRHVFLTVTNPIHVAKYGTFVTTPFLKKEHSSGKATVNVKTKILNETKNSQTVTVVSDIIDASGKKVASSEKNANAEAQKVSQTEQNILVESPVLWDLSNPYVYKLHTTIKQGDKVLDTFDTDFGFKWMDFTPNDGCFLNGKYIKLHGVCMHHDQGALGAVSNKTAVYRQVRIMKEMGVNAIRTSHNPASKELIDACNRLGMLVFEEAFDTWYGSKKAYDYGRFFEQLSPYNKTDGSGEKMTWAESDIKTMVDKDKNQPCLMMWSIGNEIDQTAQTKGIQTAKNLNRWIKEIDTTHPTTIGENKFRANPSATVYGCANSVDLVGNNYSEQLYDTFHQKYPNWIIYGSETSSAVRSRGVYKNQGLELSSYDTERVGWGKTAENAWKYDRDRRFVLGEFIWTGFDYIGEPTPFYNHFPAKSSYFGAVDTAGFPKDIFYYYQSQWFSAKEKPMVHLLPHWNWKKGSTVQVWAYTNADSVKLYLNDKFVGEKRFESKTTSDGRTYLETSSNDKQNPNSTHLQWSVPFEEGTLRAEAYKDGKLIAKDSVTTAGNASKIKLIPERKIIKDDGKDLSYIEVNIADKNGLTVPTANNKVYFDISGNGKIVGVDNGDAACVESYKGSSRSAFSGKALVIVKSKKQGGAFTLKASSNGLTGTSTTVFTSSSDTAENQVLGYNISQVTTSVGKTPSLPSKVEAVLSDGTSRSMPVIWADYDMKLLQKGGKFTVNGTVTGSKIPAEITVLVRAPIGISPIHVAVGVGTKPSLPSKVQLMYNTGESEFCDVTWEEITKNQISSPRTFTIHGDVKGTSFKAEASIRVTNDVLDNINLAPRAVEITESEARGDNLNSINDGKIGSTEPNKRWTNWNSGVSTDGGWVGFRWNQKVTVKSVNLYYYTDGSVKLPADVVISYWDGSAWQPVKNQKNPSWTASDSKNTITFDSVNTTKIKVYMKAQPKRFVGITEAEVIGDFLNIYSTAKLSEITVNGKKLENFSQDKFSYTVKVPYGSEVPAVKAKAEQNAAVAIVPALSCNDQALIKVTSEDGLHTNEYAVRFEEDAAPIVSAKLSASKTTIAEDDVLPLNVSAFSADGKEISEKDSKIEYRLQQQISNTAEIEQNKLYAYHAGVVTVTAQVTYLGKTISSNALKITINKSNVPKNIVSFEKVKLVTDKGKAPNLPSQVKAFYDHGLPHMVNVTWQPVTPDIYNNFGEYTVTGSVKGTNVKAVANILVKGIIAVQNKSLVTIPNVVPALPDTTTVYYSDGTKTIVPVAFDPIDASLLTDGKTLKVMGTVSQTSIKPTLSIRVTSKSVNGDNLALARNGWDLPAAISSFADTNRNDGGDLVANLNDGVVEHDPTAPNNRWCNWIVPVRAEDWAGVVFGHGKPEKRSINNLEVEFYKDPENITNPAALPDSYVIEYYDGNMKSSDIPDNKNKVSESLNSPLNNAENWKPVQDLKAPKVLSSSKNNIFTFHSVNTCAIRIRMKAKPHSCLAITELRSFEKVPVCSSNAALEDLKADGKILKEFAPDKTEYTVYADHIPNITATSKEHAAVTVIPSIGYGSPAKVEVVSEDGKNTLSYLVHFVKPAKPLTVTKINLTTSSDIITSPKGTLQFKAEIFPENALNKKVVWSVEKAEGSQPLGAAISSSGLLTAGTRSEKVKVIAKAVDGSNVQAEKIITIAIAPSADKSALKKLILQAQSYPLDQFIRLGKENFSKALKNAIAIENKPNASLDEINKTCEELQNAMKQLKKRADNAELKKMIENMKKINLSDYTKESAQKFSKAMQHAQKICSEEISEDNGALIQNEIKTLKEAFDSLNKKRNSDNHFSTPRKAEAKADSSVTKSSASTGETSSSTVFFAIMAISVAFICAIRRKKR